MSASYAPVYGFIRESAGRHGLAPEFLQTVVFGEGVGRSFELAIKNGDAFEPDDTGLRLRLARPRPDPLPRRREGARTGNPRPHRRTELNKPVLTAKDRRSWPSTTFNLVDEGYVDQATADAVELTEEFARTEGDATRTIQLANVHGWANGIELIAAELHARLDEMVAYLASKTPPVLVTDELVRRYLAYVRFNASAVDVAPARRPPRDATRALARRTSQEQPRRALQHAPAPGRHAVARGREGLPMTTVADIEGRELTPLSALLAAADVPGDLVELDGDLAALLDRALFTDATLQPVENGYLGGIVLVLTEEVALRPFGDALVLALGERAHRRRGRAGARGPARRVRRDAGAARRRRRPARRRLGPPARPAGFR